MHPFKRILVVRTDRIGDVILTLPMLELLRKNFPNARITLLVRCYTKELVDQNDAVDEVLEYDDGGILIPFLRMAETLRSKQFDVAFVTYPRFRLAWLMYWSGIPLRVGTGYRWYSLLFNKRVFVHRKVAEKHEAEYNIDLLKAVGCENIEMPYPRLRISQETMGILRARLQEFGILAEKPLVILHPGTGGSAREWSPSKFSELGRKLRQCSDVQVVVTGGRGEEHLARSVARMIGADTPAVVNQLSLREYAALARMAFLLVANSTGPLHIAAAVGTPVIGLYPQVTAMSARRWGPFTDKKSVFVPQEKPANCRVCVLGGECECMNSISVDDVFDAVKEYIITEEISSTK